MEKDPNYPAPMKGLDFEPVDRTDSKGKLVRATVLPNELIYMPKLNGVRMRWDIEGQCLRTNNGIRIGSCDHIVEQIMASELRHLPLDGESYVHDSGLSFQKINGLTRRKKTTEETMLLEYHVFDLAHYDKIYSKKFRLKKILEKFSVFDDLQNLHIVPWAFGKPEHVDIFFKKALGNGYEGIMICDPHKLYTPGKGKWMWKYKPAYDAEFTFLGFEYAEEGRNVEMFASIILGMKTGRTFTCAGIPDEVKKSLLKNPPPIGAKVTIEYGDLSEDGVPIFPRYKDVRWDQ